MDYYLLGKLPTVEAPLVAATEAAKPVKPMENKPAPLVKPIENAPEDEHYD